jgi:hypothetical protein
MKWGYSSVGRASRSQKYLAKFPLLDCIGLSEISPLEIAKIADFRRDAKTLKKADFSSRLLTGTIDKIWGRASRFPKMCRAKESFEVKTTIDALLTGPTVNRAGRDMPAMQPQARRRRVAGPAAYKCAPSLEGF